MEQSARDRILAMLLPAILVGAGYMLFFNKQKDLDAAEAELAAAKASAVDPMMVDLERMKLAELREKGDELKAAVARLNERRAALATVGKAPPMLRTQALRQLSNMLWDRGLYPFEESPLEGTSAKLSPSFDDVLKKLAKPSSTSGGVAQSAAATPIGSNSNEQRVWRIRFYGRYSDVMRTLEALRDSESPVIPISLTMSEARTETQWRSWTLLLWI